MITLNGKEKDYREITITELLEKEGLAGVRVAVELNGQIIRKNNFENVIVKDMDKVEVVSFVGGG
jgi:sulfur carrier protein